MWRHLQYVSKQLYWYWGNWWYLLFMHLYLIFHSALLFWLWSDAFEYLCGLMVIHLSCLDSSCISHWWNSENSPNSTRWDEGRSKLFPRNNMERRSKIFATSWYSVEEHWDKWTCSLQCSSYSVLFLDGRGSWWFVIFIRMTWQSFAICACRFYYCNDSYYCT